MCAGDQCPMYFDDGSNPWKKSDNVINVFNFGYLSGGADSFNMPSCLIIFIGICFNVRF